MSYVKLLYLRKMSADSPSWQIFEEVFPTRDDAEVRRRDLEQNENPAVNCSVWDCTRGPNGA